MSKKIDFRWLITGLVLVGVLVAAVFINLDHTKTDSAKFANNLDIDNGDLNIDWSHYQTQDIKLTESLKITEAGTYHLTGILEDGNITIEAGVSNVRLI